MKRVVLLIWLSFFLSNAAYAQDEQKVVRLNVETAKRQSVRVNGFCEFHFRIEEEMDDGAGVVSVCVDNISPQTVILFHKQGSEKSLKKGPIKIKFNKSFTGRKGKRTIAQFPNIDIDRILPKDVEGVRLFSFLIKEGEPVSFTMPLYLAECFLKGIAGGSTAISYSLVDMRNVGVTAELEKFVDTVYPSLYGEYEELAVVLDTVKFCPNEDHQPPLAVQKSVWQARVDAFKARVDSVAGTCGYSPKRLTPYKELAEKVAQISLDDEDRLVDCGQHHKHECSYCGLSLRQIYIRMEDIYMRIITSDDMSAVKKKYWPQISSMYACVCEAKRTESDRGGFRGKIDKYYKSIKNIR